MVEYETIRVSRSIKERLDDEKGDSETRNEQIERLLSDNDVSPFDDELERRLKSVETKLENLPRDVASMLRK